MPATMQSATQTESHFSKKPMEGAATCAPGTAWSVMCVSSAQPAFGSLRPISSSRFCSASLSSVFIGRLVKIEMRLLSMR